MNIEQWQRSKKIKAEAEAAAKHTVERVLNAVKEPAMSEFKVGDRIVYLADWDDFDGIMTYDSRFDDNSWNHKNMIRKATPEEIAAGYRIDQTSDSRELETLDKPENHISPNCKVKDV